MKEAFLEKLTLEEKKGLIMGMYSFRFSKCFKKQEERQNVIAEIIETLEVTNPDDVDIIKHREFLTTPYSFSNYEYIPEKRCLAFGKSQGYPNFQNFIQYNDNIYEAKYKKLLELRIKQFEEKNPTEEPNSSIYVGFIHSILEKNKYDYKIQGFKVIDFNESIIEIFEVTNSKVYNHKIKLPENIFFQLYYNPNFSYEVIVDCTTGIVKINHMDDDDNFTKKYPNGELINKNETLILQEKVRESFLQKTTSTQTTEEDNILENIYSINKNGKLSISTFTQTEPDIEQPQIMGDILE